MLQRENEHSNVTNEVVSIGKSDGFVLYFGLWSTVV